MALLPLLTNIAIPLGIKFVNSLIDKPKSGAEKKNLLTELLNSVIAKLKALGVTSEDHPGADVLSGLIEGVFAPMKVAGTETASLAAPELWLLRGAGITITKIPSGA